MAGIILGMRYTARKLPTKRVLGGRTIHAMELIREELHSTKGWRYRGREVKFLQNMEWISLPAKAAYFIRNPQLPKGVGYGQL